VGIKRNKSKQQKEGELNMNPAVIEKIAEAVKAVADLCKKVIEAGDPEKYANSVESLNRGVSDTYEQMRAIIVNSEKFSEEEKLERLTALAAQEQASKQKCDEAIKGNRQQVASIALEVTKGLLTCGVYYVPGIAKGFGKNKRLANDPQLLQEEN
jgi:hypothetical protein